MELIKRFALFLKRWWLRFAKGLAVVNTAVLLTIAYVLVIGPLSLFIRILGKDFLQLKNASRASFWRDREETNDTLDTAERQF